MRGSRQATKKTKASEKGRQQKRPFPRIECGKTILNLKCKIVQLAFLCSGGVSLRRARERQTMRAEARRSRQRRAEEEEEEESAAAAERRGEEEEENDEGQVEVTFEILE